MLSFRIQDARAPFELLPHHWRTKTAMQEKFNARIKRAVLGNQEFTLLCNQEFWEDFQAWLNREFTDHFEILSVKSFSSSQVLEAEENQAAFERKLVARTALVPEFRWKTYLKQDFGQGQRFSLVCKPPPSLTGKTWR